MLQKSLKTNADTIIYDLEDSVAPSERDKSTARDKLSTFLSSTAEKGLPHKSQIAVRLNDITTPFFERDIDLAVRTYFWLIISRLKIYSYAIVLFVHLSCQKFTLQTI